MVPGTQGVGDPSADARRWVPMAMTIAAEVASSLSGGAIGTVGAADSEQPFDSPEQFWVALVVTRPGDTEIRLGGRSYPVSVENAGSTADGLPPPDPGFSRMGLAVFSLTFEDGSVLEFPAKDGEAEADLPEVLDRGELLLDPITDLEFRGVEAIIGELFRAAGLDALTSDQEDRVLKLAQLILWQRNQIEPGRTPRWTMIGVTRSVLLRLAVDVPLAVTGNAVYDLCLGIGWRDLAEALLHSPLPPL